MSGYFKSGYIYAGVPAKAIKTIDKYMNKLSKESLHLGHLKGKVKEKAIKKHLGIK